MAEYYAAMRSKGLNTAKWRQTRSPREKGYSRKLDTQLPFITASLGEKFLGGSVARCTVGCA